MQALIFLVVLNFVAGGGPAPTTAKRVPSPEVYLYGNVIPRPYIVELVGATVRINGIQVVPQLVEAEPPVIEPTPAAVEQHALSMQGWDLKRRLEGEGKCCGEIAMALADLYRSRSDLVAEVRDVRDNSFWVRWTDGSEEQILVVATKRAQTPEEDARGEFQFIQRVLEKGGIIIVSSSGRVTVPADDAQRLTEVHAEITRAQRTSIDMFGSVANGYVDNRWNGKYLPADIARQFARPLKLTTQRQED